MFRGLLLLAIVIADVSTLHAQSQSPPAPTAARVPSEAVSRFLRRWMWDSGGGRLLDTSRYWSETWATAAPLPTEGGQLRAEAIYVSGRSWCGTSGCVLVIVTEDTAGKVRLVGEVGLMQLPIRVLTIQHAGLPDLAGTVFGGGVMDPYLVRLRYDGKAYPDDINDLPKMSPDSGGRELITEAMPETRIWPVPPKGKLVRRCYAVVRTAFGPMRAQRHCPTTR
jgi:hypothetical protein